MLIILDYIFGYVSLHIDVQVRYVNRTHLENGYKGILYKPHVRAFPKYFASLGHIPYDPFMF